MIRLSSVCLLTCFVPTRRQKSYSERNGPSFARIYSISPIACSPTLRTAASPKRIAFPSTLKDAALADTGYRAEPMLEYLASRVSRLTVVDADRALREVGSPKVLNLILLGAAVRSGALRLTAEDLKEAVRRLVPTKFHELNFRALDYES